MLPALLVVLVLLAMSKRRAPDPVASLEPDVEELARRLVTRAAGDPELQQLALELYLPSLELAVTEGRRTPERQAELYAQGRTTPGPVVTWTLDSAHVDGRAFDVAFSIDGAWAWPEGGLWDRAWERVGELGEELGLQWGGRWVRRDRPHFELERRTQDLAGWTDRRGGPAIV